MHSRYRKSKHYYKKFSQRRALRQYRNQIGIDFNYPLPEVMGINMSTMKIEDAEYLNLAIKFIKSRKCRRKIKWLHKFSRKLTQAIKKGTVKE